MRVVKVFAALLFTALLLVGCWDQQEITDLAPITGLGIDPGERPGTVRVSVQISPPAPAALGGAGAADPALRVITVEAATVFEALTLLFAHTRREPFYWHVGFIVFGEEMARAGIGGVIGGMHGMVTIRGSVPVLVAIGPAEEILKARSGTGRAPGNDVLNLLSTLRAAPLGATVNLNDVITTLTGLGSELVLPVLELTPLRLQRGNDSPNDGTSLQGTQLQEVIITRMALFNRDRWVEALDPYRTQTLVLLRGFVGVGGMTMPHPTDPNGVMAVQYEDFRSTLTPRVAGGGEVSLDVKITIRARLIEARGYYDYGLYGPNPITKILEEEVTAQVVDLFSTMQGLGIDSLGVGDMIYRNNPRAWSMLEPVWDKSFSLMPVRVQTDAKLTGTSLIVKLFDVKRRKPGS